MEIPQRYYKYVTAEACKIILRTQTLRWSTPRTLNDPFDNRFDLHSDIDRAAVKRDALRFLWDRHYGKTETSAENVLGFLVNKYRDKFPPLDRNQFDAFFSPALDEILEDDQAWTRRLNDEIRPQMEQNKLLCLTIDPVNILMWSHYADQQQGAVLCFHDAPGKDSPWSTARPIRYVEKMPRLWDDKFLAKQLGGGARLNPSEMLDILVYTKSREWAYEKEWRIFSGSGRNPDAPYEDSGYHPLELESVIFGSRMPAEQRFEIVSILSQKRFSHVGIKEIVRDDFEFKLAIRDFCFSI